MMDDIYRCYKCRDTGLILIVSAASLKDACRRDRLRETWDDFRWNSCVCPCNCSFGAGEQKQMSAQLPDGVSMWNVDDWRAVMVTSTAETLAAIKAWAAAYNQKRLDKRAEEEAPYAAFNDWNAGAEF